MGLSKSQGGSTQGDSRSQSITGQNIWDAQAGPLSGLYQGAQNTYNNIAEPFAQRAGWLGNAYGAGGTLLAGQLANTGIGEQGNAFMNTLQQQSQMSNPYLNQQVAGLQRDMQTGLEQALGNIGQGFVGAGQYGGSRQGLAEGQAIRGALDTYGQQVANLRAGDLDRQLSAAQSGVNAALGQQGNQLIGQSTALNALPGLMNLGLSPYTSQLGLLGQYADVLGAPTALTSSLSQSESTTRGRGGDSFGFSLI